MKLKSEFIPTKDMREAAELCCKEPLRSFLKKEWKPRFGDWTFCEIKNLFGIVVDILKDNYLQIEWMYSVETKIEIRRDIKKDKVIWIPIIAEQTDNLLLDLERFSDYDAVRYHFNKWVEEKCGLLVYRKEIWEGKAPDFLLKIIWLSKILGKIDEEKGGKKCQN